MNSAMTSSAIPASSPTEIDVRCKALGDFIAQAMKVKGLSIQDVAERSKLWHRDSLARLIRGMNPPPRALLERKLADDDPRYAALADVLDLEKGPFIEQVKKLQEDADHIRKVADSMALPLSEVSPPRGATAEHGRNTQMLSDAVDQYVQSAFQKSRQDVEAAIRANHVERLMSVADVISDPTSVGFDDWTQAADLRVRVAWKAKVMEQPQGRGAEHSLTFGFDGATSGVLTGGTTLAGIADDLWSLHQELRQRGLDDRLLSAIRRIKLLSDLAQDNYDMIANMLLETIDSVEVRHGAAAFDMTTLRKLLDHSGVKSSKET